MKKLLLALTIIASALMGARAGIVASDNFIYNSGTVSNGVLTTISGGTWYGHSGAGSVPILVSNALARITSGSGSREDDSLDLAGGPYLTNSGTVLYSSYTLIVSNTAGISAAGGYITHFKNLALGTSFHGRVWLSTSNYTTATVAPPGQYLIGIGNGSLSDASSGQLNTLLNVNVPYTIVTRCNLTNNQTSTIWVNPSLESDPSATAADFNDPTNQAAMGSYAFRQGAAGAGTNYVGNLKIGTIFADVAGANTSPTISSIPAQNISSNGTTGPLFFTVSDAETPAGNLIVTASSSNPSLVPNDAAHLTLATNSPPGNREIIVTPATVNPQGSATITVTVSDTVNTSFTTFVVKVGAPTLSTIPNQIAVTNTTIPGITFAVSDPESDSLALWSTSSNTNVIKTNNITFSGSGPTRTVTLVPEAGQLGVSTITVFITDNHNTNSTSFTLTMRPLIGLVYDEDFLYTGFDVPNALHQATGGSGEAWSGVPAWKNISGPFYQVQVTNGWAYLVHTNNEDLGASLTNAPYSGSNGVVLYTGFPVTFSFLPSPAGDYFFHLKESKLDTINFRGKIFARTTGAAPGQFRLGVANQQNSPVLFPLDLSTNTTNTVVMRYNAGTGETVLWVNPANEQSSSVTAQDSPGQATIGGLALRQPGSAIGDLAIGHLKIGTSFSDVFTASVPTPELLQYQVLGTDFILSWSNPLFSLSTATNVLGPYTTITGSTSPYTNAILGSAKFFRLIYP